jgi:hypothetical protein
LIFLCKEKRIEKELEDYFPLSLVESEKFEIVAFEGQKSSSGKKNT